MPQSIINMSKTAFISGICSLLVLVAPTGCSVYHLNNKLSSAERARETPCEVRYSFSLDSGSFTNTFGPRQDASPHLESLSRNYIGATAAVFEELGCRSTLVSPGSAATLKVSVERHIQLSSLPQEWLTGLSFGLIPSWGTRNKQIRFTFVDETFGTKHSYTVDETTYSHLILLPICWISFFTADEVKVYREALRDFALRGHNQSLETTR